MTGEPVAVGLPVDRSVVLGLSRGGGGVSVFVRGSCSSSSEASNEKKGEACALGLIVLSGVFGEIVESVLVIVGCADCRGEGVGSEVEVGCFREDRAEGIGVVGGRAIVVTVVVEAATGLASEESILEA